MKNQHEKDEKVFLAKCITSSIYALFCLLIVSSSVLVSMVSPLFAQEQNIVYVRPEVSAGFWPQSPVTIDFELYRDEYAWLGKTGSVPRGLKTKGWPEGEWHWVHPTALEFIPTGYWKAGETYELDLSTLQIPPNISLAKDKVSYKHIKRAVKMEDARFWVDPSPKADHAVSFSMRFTEQLDSVVRKNLEESAYIKSEDAKGLELSQLEWVWLDNNTRAVVNARILTLPQEQSIVTLTLPEMLELKYDDAWYLSGQGATKDLRIEGTESIFTIESYGIEPHQNKALEMEQHLVFRFSQRVGVEELLNALTVLELPLQKSDENIVPTTWTDGYIGEDIRNKARVIKPEPIRLAGESADVLRFRLDTSPEHYILWNIDTGFGPTNEKGVKTSLRHKAEGIEYIGSGESRLELLQSGSMLMPDSNIVMMSENLDSVRWSAYRILDTALALPFLYSLDNMLGIRERNASSVVARGEILVHNKNSHNTENLSMKESKEASYSSSPVFHTLQAKDIFGEITENNQEANLSSGLVYLLLEGVKDGEVIAERGRLLMQSHMALVLKTLANDRMEAYICDLDSAKPLENISVEVLGYNGLPIASVKTDISGKAILPDLSSFNNEEMPVAIVARRYEKAIEKPILAENMLDAESHTMVDMIWMSLLDYNRYVNLSHFAELEGKQNSGNTLNAFAFAERGLFSPGDTLNFATLLRANDWKMLPKEMPLLAQIQDASGRKVYEQKFKAGDNIHSFSWEIPQSVMTGKYRLSITNMGGGFILGSHSVRIETFLPDTLRIKTQLVTLHKEQAHPEKMQDTENIHPTTDILKDTEDTSNKQIEKVPSFTPLPTKGWLLTSDDGEGISLHVQLDTLYGQVAQNRRVTSEMYLNPARLYFEKYKDYTFQDVSPYFGRGVEPITRPLKATTTDETGQAFIPLDFNQWRFGTLQCTLKTEGYEPSGGRAVSQELRFLLSSMPFMLGYKTGEGADNKDFILKDSQAQLKFQAIDSELNGVDTGTLIFSVLRRQSVQSLTSDALGQYTYTQTPVETEVLSKEERLAKDGTLTWNIPTEEVGDYLLTVRLAPKAGSSAEANALQNMSDEVKTQDKLANAVLAQIPFSIVGNDDLRPALKNTWQLPEAHLHIKTDKTHYSGGENANIMITAPYDGVALLSLERDTVEAHKWLSLPVGTSMHQLEIPKDFTGRAYIQVLMGRAPQSDNIFIQPQSVAVASITVNSQEKSIPLAIHVDEKIRPGQSLHARIGNTKAKPMKAVIYAVDEGILQLSNYQTPHPLEYLLLDRALVVRTAQLFDRFIPHDSKVMSRLSAFGGDGLMMNSMRNNLLGKFQNPFKRKSDPPMRWWSGVVDVPVEGLEVEIPIPDYYNGTLRLMVVAYNEDAVGHTDKNVIVQDEQVLTTQVPTMFAIGDSFIGGLNIANTTDNVLKLQTSLHLDPQSTAKDIALYNFVQSVILAPNEERYITFNVDIGQEPGVAILRFETEDEEGVKRERRASFSVRPPLMPYYSQKSLMLHTSRDIQAERELLPYNAQKNVTISPIPLPLLQSTLNYLYNYPYNCVEQSLSKAFPLVALNIALRNSDLKASDVNSDLAQLVSVLENKVPSLQKKEQEKILKNAHNALLLAYKPYEGVSLWEDRNQVDIFFTAYAADYVLGLKDAGLLVPPGILPNLFSTLERSINTSPHSVGELRALAYASWVLARAGFVVSKQLELCENYIRNKDLTQSDIYNSLMAGAYKMLFMEEEAQKHLQKVLGDAPKTWVNPREYYTMFDTLARYGLHARVLAKHFPKEFQNSIEFLQYSLLEGLNKSHATLGASMSALALIDIIIENAKETPTYGAGTQTNGQVFGLENLEAFCSEYQASLTAQDLPQAMEQEKAEIYHQFYLLSAPLCKKFAVNIQAEKSEHANNAMYFAQLEEYGYDTHMPKEALEEGISVKQTYSLESGMPFENSITQGEILRVDVDIQALDNHEIPVAVVSLLPGGFELVLNHEDDSSASQSMSLMRDEDRVIAFLDANREKTRITYHIRAIAQGDFIVPAVHAEGLFDTSLQSHSAGARVFVFAP